MEHTLAQIIATNILADVTDRRGWRHEWERFDDDIQIEIFDTWIEIIEKALTGGEIKQTKWDVIEETRERLNESN